MKVLMVHPGPDFSVHDVFVGWTKAFVQQGHQVHVYNTNDRLRFFNETDMEDGAAVLASFEGLGHHLYSFWPDLVVFVSAFYVRQEILSLIRARGHKIAIIHTESPYQDDEQLMRAQYAHLNVLNDPTNLTEYSYLSPSIYIPHAYDPDTHYPNFTEPKKIDFSFVGSMFPSRTEFFERMFTELGDRWLDKHVVAMGGQAWTQPELDESPLLKYLGHPRAHAIDNAETANIYRDTRIGINVYRKESEESHAGEGYAMGPREVELAACGIPFLRDSRPESDEVFPFLRTFGSPEDAAWLLKWYVYYPYQAEKLGVKAREAIEDRTFRNNADKLMRALESVGAIR